MTVAGQPQVTYSYDNANRLTQIAQGTSTVGFSYDTVNRRSTLTLSNGVNMSYTYDNDSRVTGITYKFNANTLGNLTYSYDSLGRRTQVAGSFAQTGLPGSMTSATYDAANELLTWNGTSISYDSNGNMLSDGSNAFTWNARNQVATLNNVSLQYDAAGRRIKNAAGTSFLYNGANTVQELSGTTVTANMLGGGVDEVFTRADSSGLFTPLKDALGSTIALVDAGGNLETTYSYDPFGNTTVSGTVSSNPLQYTGRENEGNGLYFYRARYYSPMLGRFINEDPSGFAAGINPYRYVLNNPLMYRDPSGLQNQEPDDRPSSGCKYELECVYSPEERERLRQESEELYQQLANEYDRTHPPLHSPVLAGRPKCLDAIEPPPPVKSPEGFDELIPLFEAQEWLEFQVTNRVLIPGALIGSGLVVAGVGGVATAAVCSTGVGCLLSPVTGGVALAGLGLAGEGVYYGIHQRFYFPSFRH